VSGPVTAYCKRCGVIPYHATRERVLLWLEQNEGADATCEDIGDDIGIDPHRVSASLKQMRTAGEVRMETGPRIGPRIPGARKRFRRYYIAKEEA